MSLGAGMTMLARLEQMGQVDSQLETQREEEQELMRALVHHLLTGIPAPMASAGSEATIGPLSRKDLHRACRLPTKTMAMLTITQGSRDMVADACLAGVIGVSIHMEAHAVAADHRHLKSASPNPPSLFEILQPLSTLWLGWRARLLRSTAAAEMVKRRLAGDSHQCWRQDLLGREWQDRCVGSIERDGCAG